MSPLEQQIGAKKAAEAAPSCHTGGMRHNRAFVEFRPDPHTRIGFPWAQLCHYSLDPVGGGELDAPERLTLAFSTADVVVTGARLAKLVDLVNEHDLDSVSALDARYAGTLGSNPWVAKIAIAHIGKP